MQIPLLIIGALSASGMFNFLTLSDGVVVDMIKKVVYMNPRINTELRAGTKPQIYRFFGSVHAPNGNINNFTSIPILFSSFPGYISSSFFLM